MKRDWREYDDQRIKRGEILINPQAFGFEGKHEQEEKKGRPFTYSEFLIRMLLFIKFALIVPYGQIEGLAKRLLSSSGVKVPNFRTLHYSFLRTDIKLESFPAPEGLPDDFVIILDSAGVKRIGGFG